MSFNNVRASISDQPLHTHTKKEKALIGAVECSTTGS